jgi:hypothetical protein
MFLALSETGHNVEQLCRRNIVYEYIGFYAIPLFVFFTYLRDFIRQGLERCLSCCAQVHCFICACAQQ